MDHDSEPPPEGARDGRLATATHDLELARRELKWARIEQEHMAESLQRVRRQRARLREQVDSLSASVADLLSAAYWAEQESGGLRGVFRRTNDTAEADLVREVEASPLFDAAWYVRTYPEAVAERLSPAAHYVRFGVERRLKPNEALNVDAYLRSHPEVVDSGLPVLVHAQRHGTITAGTKGTGRDVSADTSDVHL